jgi:NTP pyrophosphatase (non-canonical NTP hydrolase)
MLNRSDLEAFDYYDNFEAVKPTPNLDSYTEFVESMILTTGRDRLAENTLGLVGEAGEVAEKIKKHFRDATLDVSAVQKELGDVIFYWVALNNALGLDAMDTILKNMEKLSARQRNGTLRGSGDNR